MSGREIVQNLKFRKPTVEFNATELSKEIEQGYLEARRESRFVKKTTFSPSSIGGYNGLCPRYWYLAFDGAMSVDNVDAIGLANMQNGTAAHTRIQKVFADAGILVDDEVEIRLVDPPIRGFIDVLVRHGGEVVVGEIKTTRQEAFLFRQNSMSPSPQHLLQILIYMDATKKKHGFLMYENKNTQEFVVIPVEMTERNAKILSDVYDWLRTVRKAWEDRTLPKRPFQKRNKICQACPFFEICWDGPDGVLKIPAMEVVKA